jgi:hypothetical protein
MNWQGIHNRHTHETGLIICNGKSLEKVPIGFLAKYPSIGLNGIYRLQFQPTYYVAINELVLQQFDISKVVCEQKFVREQYAKACGALPLHSDYIDGTFSFTPDNWVFEGGTVTYVALQLAYYMGFSTVLLVGLDHRYEYAGAPNEEVIITAPDTNHFKDNYFEVGMKFNNPDLVQSQVAYETARDIFKANDRRIINLTPGTDETVFEKGQIEDWF